MVAEKTSQDFIQEHTSYLQSAGPVIAGSFHDISRNITLINPTVRNRVIFANSDLLDCFSS